MSPENSFQDLDHQVNQEMRQLLQEGGFLIWGGGPIEFTVSVSLDGKNSCIIYFTIVSLKSMSLYNDPLTVI